MSRRKALGQHFLANRSILRKIIAVIAPRSDELIIEIGAGKGALTFLLSEQCAKVVAIEKDKALIPFLLEMKPVNVAILEKDVLEVKFKDLLAGEKSFQGKAKIVGNIPYSISAPLLFQVLEEKDFFSACVFLLQKEVAERIAAGPGTKKFAPLSILFQLAFDVRRHFDVAPGSFIPPPRVVSTLISLTRREQPLYAVRDEQRFRDFLRLCFAGRRKTLLNNLKKLALPAGAARTALERLDLRGNIRAEQLTIAQFVQLYDLLRPCQSR
jgi:16S rRNA (adenine1518-N6/adenine1519-N6)-dimethyltransferase